MGESLGRGRGLRMCGVVLLLAGGSGLGARGQAVGAATVRVHGVVVDGVTGQPVGRALVTTGDQRMALLADGEGRFDFEVRVPGKGADRGGQSSGVQSGVSVSMGFDRNSMVILMGRKPGYLQMQQPTVLNVGDSEAVRREVRLKLVPEAVVTGRVAAAEIESPAGVQVSLLRRQVEEGVAVWRPMQDRQTDARGEYRFTDLAAGEYKVITREYTEQGQAVPVAGRVMVGYPPVAYGGGRTVGSAAVLHVGAGETVRADLNLRAERYYPVEIPVTGYVPGGGINVSVEDGDGGSGFSLGANQGTGVVEGALPVGMYRVTVVSYGAEGQQAMGSAEIAVAAGGFHGGAIALGPGGTIPVVVREEYTAAAKTGGQEGVGGTRLGGFRSGRLPITTVDGKEVRPRSVEMYLTPVGGGEMAGLGDGPGKGSGEEGLVLENVRPGTYRAVVTPHRGYAAKVTYRGVDVLRQPLVVGAGAGRTPIEITLQDDTGTISGTVSAAAGAGAEMPGFAAMVWCLPVGEETPGRPVQGYAGPDGKFSLGNLPPGRYHLLAFRSAMNSLEYRNEEAMRRYEGKGAMVTLLPGQTLVVGGPLVPLEED